MSSPELMIMTTQGLKRVEDLIHKKFTAVVNGKEYPSSERGFWQLYDHDMDIYKITLQNGIEISVSNSQCLYGDGCWKAVKYLKVGDEIALSNNREYSWDSLPDSLQEGYSVAKDIIKNKLDKIPLDRDYCFERGILFAFFEYAYLCLSSDKVYMFYPNTAILKQIQILLTAFSIKTKLIEDEHTLVLKKDNLQRFIKYIGLKEELYQYVKNFLVFFKEGWSSKIKSIECCGKGKVYICDIDKVRCISANGIITLN